jgi:site-specific recombinase XerD
MSSLTLSNAVTAYIQSLVQAGKAQRTITVYRNDLLILTRLLNQNHRLLFIDNVTQGMLETAISDPEWINRSDGEMASQSTQARRFTAVSGFFEWAYKVGLLKENPISLIIRPQQSDRLAPYILNDSEVTRLREILKKHTRWTDCRDRVIIECFLSIGLQFHNVIKLKMARLKNILTVRFVQR